MTLTVGPIKIFVIIEFPFLLKCSTHLLYTLGPEKRREDIYIFIKFYFSNFFWNVNDGQIE